MSKANSGDQVLNTDVSYFYFKPDENRKDVITTLEEWTARLLKQNITEQNRETRKRLGRAKEPSTLVKFKLSTTNYSNKYDTQAKLNYFVVPSNDRLTAHLFPTLFAPQNRH